MDERDEPCRWRTRIAIFAGAIGHFPGSSILPRDADVPQPAQIVNDLIQPRIGIGRLVQSGNDRFDEFARQPYDALILGLNARSSLQDKPRDIDREPDREDERQQQIDPGAQG